MALAHRRWPVYGVQFHPESILSEGGYAILANFLHIAGVAVPHDLPAMNEERPTIEPRPAVPMPPVTF
jgi:hypothetical protein